MILNYQIKASKMRKKDGLSPLEVVVTINHQRRSVTLERFYKASTFNSKNQRFVRNKSANEYIATTTERFYALEKDMVSLNIPVTIDTVVDAFKHGIHTHTMTLLTLFDMHNVEAKQKADTKLISVVTYDKYIRTREYVASFLKTKFPSGDILLQMVTPSLLESFYVYLHKYMGHNTATHKMKLLKKIFRIAQEEQYIRTNPMRLKLTTTPLEYTPLTVDEIRLIREKEITIPRLTFIRDLFIFECYSGLAFTDMSKLTKEHIHVDAEHNEWIILSRQKTKVLSTIPLLTIAKEILVKYDYHLPRISNQKYNSYLKELADICGIDKNLHSHLARHTFATILLNSGVDMVSVSKILGHSNSKITEKIYAQMLQSTIGTKVKSVENSIV